MALYKMYFIISLGFFLIGVFFLLKDFFSRLFDSCYDVSASVIIFDLCLIVLGSLFWIIFLLPFLYILGCKSASKFKIVLIFLFSFNIISICTPTYSFINKKEYALMNEVIKEKYCWAKTNYIYSAYRETEVREGINIFHVFAVMNVESSGSTWATSCSNARGLMQIMEFHLPAIYCGNVYTLYASPMLNIYLGTKLYTYCLYLSKGNVKEAYRLYNAGPNSNRALYKNWKYAIKVENDYYSMIKKYKKLKKENSFWSKFINKKIDMKFYEETLEV